MAKLIDAFGKEMAVDVQVFAQHHPDPINRRVLVKVRDVESGKVAELYFDRHSAIDLATDFYNRAEELFPPVVRSKTATEVNAATCAQQTHDAGEHMAKFFADEIRAQGVEVDDPIEMAAGRLRQAMREARLRMAFAILRGEQPSPEDEQRRATACWNLQQLTEG